MNSKQKTNKGGNGRWTKTEHERFLKGLERYGRDWVSVQKVVKTRSLIQVRSHAQKVFMKMSESEIKGLIGEDYEFQSSFGQAVERSFVTESQHLESQKKQINTPIKQAQNSLLDMFLQALENEGISIFQQNQSISEKNFTPQKSFSSLDGDKLQRQTEIQLMTPASLLPQIQE